MPFFKYNGKEIEYTLSRNAKRNVNFRIKPDGEIYVSAPKRINKKELEKMILEHADWMVENHERIIHQKKNISRNHIENGSTVFLNGSPYTISIIPAEKNLVQIKDNKIIICVKENYINSDEYIQKFFNQWMKKVIYVVSDKFIDYYLAKLDKYNLAKPELTIKTMTGRWGSCTPSKGKITINQNLIYPPQECLEYVVLHELSHLVEANHSKRFYAIIEEIMPDWKERRQTLNNF